MKYWKVFWTVLLTCLVFFITDGLVLGEAQASPAETAWAQGQAESILVARKRRSSRRRRKRKRKRKAKPKPKPKSVAEESPPEAPSDAGDSVPMGPGGRARVDFEAQLIKGQTTKSGEVQILARKDSELRSMVMRRTSFRDEIIESVFPEKAGK
ncbi:MAG: hypothetical protein JRF33_21900 [Deltaproteobacteria bacterium]|nr:hypothetical protein [Deltaproteobacteria bacterium]